MGFETSRQLVKTFYQRWEVPFPYRASAFTISVIISMAATMVLNHFHFPAFRSHSSKPVQLLVPKISITNSTTTKSPSANPTVTDTRKDDESFHFVRGEFIFLSNLKKIRDHIKEITWNTSEGVFDEHGKQILSGEENIKLIRRKYGIGVKLMGQLADRFSDNAEIKPIKVNGRLSNRYLIFSLNQPLQCKNFLFFEKTDRSPNYHKLKFMGYGLNGVYANVGAFPELVQIRDKTWLVDSGISGAGGGGIVKTSLWIDLSDHIGNKVVLEYSPFVDFHLHFIDYIPYTETAKITHARFANGNYIVELNCRVQFKPDENYQAFGLRDLVVKGTIRYILNKKSHCFEFDHRHSDARLSPFYRYCCDYSSYDLGMNTLTLNCYNQPNKELHQPKDILLKAFYHQLMSTARRANYEQLLWFGSLLEDCQPSKKKGRLKKIIATRYKILDARLNKQEQ